MKSILLPFLFLSSLLSLAQRVSFQTLPWDNQDNPFKFRTSGEDYGFEPQNKDSKRVIWNVIKSTTNDGKFYLLRNTQEIAFPASPKRKPGFIYNFTTVNVDNKDEKLIVANGKKWVTPGSGPSYYIYDQYYVKVDSLLKPHYVHAIDLGEGDTLNNYWQEAQGIGDNVLIAGFSKLIWKNRILNLDSLGFNSYFHTLFSDKKTTLFYIGYKKDGSYKIITFHNDGSYTERLPNKIIHNYRYNPNTNVLTVYTTTGIFQLEGKVDKPFLFSNSEKLLKSQSIRPITLQQDGFKLDVIVTQKGFSVGENGERFTFLFESESLMKYDSLRYIEYWSTFPSFINLQKDSLLVLGFHTPIASPDSLLFLFTYRKGKFAFHKQYDLRKFDASYGQFSFYVDQKDTYLYLYKQTFPFLEIKNDSSITPITLSVPLNCFYHIHELFPDKDFVWIRGLEKHTCSIVQYGRNQDIVKGKVFYDENRNYIEDAGEAGFSSLKLKALPSGTSVIPDKDGYFTFLTLRSKDFQLLIEDSTRFSSINFTKSSFKLGVKLFNPEYGLLPSLALPKALCNTTNSATTYVKNIGDIPIELVKIRLKGKNVKFNNSKQIADTALFSYSNIRSQYTASSYFQVEFPGMDQVGKVATIITTVEGYQKGVLVYKNIDSIQIEIKCAFGPNQLTVSPVGVGQEQYILKNEPLKYQYRFENVGTDTVFQVTIKDTLSPLLNLQTLQVLNTSHPVRTEVSNNIVSFYFDHIRLPYANNGMAAGQGHVLFSVLPQGDIANNTVICNKGTIYFDQNSQAITKAVCNTLVDKIPSIVTSLKSEDRNRAIYMFPNPSSDFVYLGEEIEEVAIINSLGEQIMITKSKSINVTNLPKAVYLAKIRLRDGTIKMQKLSVQ